MWGLVGRSPFPSGGGSLGWRYLGRGLGPSPRDRLVPGLTGSPVLCPQSPQLLSPTPPEVTAPQPAHLLITPLPGL